MTILINAALLFVVLLLLFPKPLWGTIKHVALVVLVLGSALCVMLVFQSKGERTITITALDQQNEAAEGSEIIITGVVVDGIEYRADTILSGGWINENGNLRWRNYDKPADMTNAVSAKIPAGTALDIRFETNKWRGRVQVQEGDFFSTVYQVDCFSNSSDSGSSITYFSARSLSGVRMSGKVLFVCLFGLLTAFAFGFSSFKNGEVKSPQKTESSREVWLDILKVCVAPMIVLIHTVGGPYGSTPLDSPKWIGYLILNTVPRYAVPVFLMISGILLIGKEYSAAKVWRNVKKSLILLVAWNLTYIFAQALLWGPSESILSQILSLPVKRGPSGHLWYAYLLVWIYLFAPVVSLLYQALTNQLRVYFVLLTVIIPGILDLYIKIFEISAQSTLYAFQLYMTLTYIGIMFVGRLIYDNAEKIKHLGLLSLLAVVTGLGGMLAVTYCYATAHHAATDKFMAETQLLAVCYAGGMIGIVVKHRKALENMPERARRAAEWLSRHSIGIYFFHVLPIWTIGSIKISGISLSVYDGVAATLVLCVIYYVVTVIGVGLLEQIPLLKKLVT